MSLEEGRVATPHANTADVVPVLVGRQAIFDRQLEVHAYELLYRDPGRSQADVSDGDRATAKVIANAFVDLGIEAVTGGYPAFVNLTRGTITEEVAHLFPSNRFVAEILEDVDADDEVLARLKDLKESGYRIALDDFVLHERSRPLLDFADIVKIDVLDYTSEELAALVAMLKERKIKLLAEKVETHETFTECRGLGFDYFQGYFLCKPKIVAGRQNGDARIGLIELLSRINDPKSTVVELEAAICKDASLSYKLIKYINSAAFALPVQVESIKHGLMLLGRRLVQVWVNLVIMSGFQGKSSELLTTALLRARMCENIARRLGKDHADVYFTTGLFSVLDALIDMPMDKVLQSLPLSTELKTALCSREGPLGEVLDAVINYEQSSWDKVSGGEIDPGVLKKTYIEALRWVSKVLAVA